MSLINNIKGYLNFSKQANFDREFHSPGTGEKNALGKWLDGLKEPKNSEAKTEVAKTETKKPATKEVTQADKDKVNSQYSYDAFKGVEAPKAEVAKTEPKQEAKPDNSEKIAKLNKGIEVIDKNIAKASDEEFDSKVGIRDRYANKVKELGGKVTDNKNTKAVEDRKEVNKKVADELKPKDTEVASDKGSASANKFLAENGGTKAKATEPEQEIKLANVDVKATKKIPWDKNDVATGASWKNKAGQTIKSYKDKDGNIYIRGAEGKVTLFDANGNMTKAAKTKYRTMAKAFASSVAPAVAEIRENPDGDMKSVTEAGKPIQTAMKGNMGINPNTGMRDYPSNAKLER